MKFHTFLLAVLSVWGTLHFYIFLHLSALPVLRFLPMRLWVLVGVVAFSSYPATRMLKSSFKHAQWTHVLDLFASNWIGVMFLLFICLATVDIATLGGRIFSAHAVTIRCCAVAVAVLLSAVAMFQGSRQPEITVLECRLKNLPAERDGLTLTVLSDLHLGTLIGEKWLRGIIDQVHSTKPDAVLIVGDLIDSRMEAVLPMIPTLKTLHAPMGVWAVTGNHEYYAGITESVRLMEDAGFGVLRDGHVQLAPGIVLAGVDDLPTRKARLDESSPIIAALAGRTHKDAVILMSHAPVQTELASVKDVGLMLSGHTHGGQIWPFSFLVKMKFPHLVGAHDIGDMKLVIGRGTGTWGPRMRLWKRAEIIHITLRAENEKCQSAYF